MLTYFEGRVAAALLETKPIAPSAIDHLEQWRADVLAIAHKLSSDRNGFDPGLFETACGGLV